MEKSQFDDGDGWYDAADGAPGDEPEADVVDDASFAVDACILGDGPVQLHLAEILGLGVVARPDPDDPVPLVVLAERAPDVQAIAQARTWAPIRAVIAWGLPESALLRLLDLDVPVLLGLPTRAQLRRAVVDGNDDLDRAAERKRTGRLAAVEAALSTKGRSDAGLPDPQVGDR